MKRLILASAALLIAAFGRANASSLETIEYTFSQSDITTELGSPSPPPQTTVSGNFTVTFDTTSTGAGTVDAIDLAIDGHTYTTGQVGASYDSGSNTLLVGGPNAGLASVAQGTDDFTINISPAVGGTTAYGLFAYTSSAHPDGTFEGFGYSFTGGSITSQVIPTPLPDSWILLLCGGAALVACTGLGRRRKLVSP